MLGACRHSAQAGKVVAANYVARTPYGFSYFTKLWTGATLIQEIDMTIGEFKAFIEGMGVMDNPDPDQWSRIEEKLKELEDRSPCYPWYVYPPQRWVEPGIVTWTRTY